MIDTKVLEIGDVVLEDVLTNDGHPRENTGEILKDE